MIEAYAIGVAAKLEDGVSPALLKIIEYADKASASLDAVLVSVRALSKAGLTLGRDLGKAAKSAQALGDSSAGLTRASYVLDTMAASSAAVAKNLAAANVEGAGVAGRRGGASGAPSEDSGMSRRLKTAGMVVGASAAYGLYENARLLDTNIVAAGTLQIRPEQIVVEAEKMRTRELEWAQKYAFATHGEIQPFATANLESARYMRMLSAEKRLKLMDAVMPYAAIEAKYKGVELPDAVGAFIGLAHQAGAYDPKDAEPLFESMVQASLSTHASLQQITRASGYVLPSLHAAGANPTDVMFMVATMMQAGIFNTKSGTWINNLAQNALPNTLGSGLFSNEKQNLALHDLGLYKGIQPQFYKNGKFDLNKEVEILAAAAVRLTPLAFIADTRQAFGLQGQKAAAIFSEPQVLANLKALHALSLNAPAPADLRKMQNQLSTVAKADQAIANAKMTVMNASISLQGPVNKVLDAINRRIPNVLPGAASATAKQVGMLYKDELPPGASVFHAEQPTVGNVTGWLNSRILKNEKAFQISVLLDGKDIAHHVVTHITPQPTRGSTGLNPLSAPIMPSGAHR